MVDRDWGTWQQWSRRWRARSGPPYFSFTVIYANDSAGTANILSSKTNSKRFVVAKKFVGRGDCTVVFFRRSAYYFHLPRSNAKLFNSRELRQHVD